MAKFLNPVEKARKEAKQKEIKKNKKRRQEQRAEAEKLKKLAAEEAAKNSKPAGVSELTIANTNQVTHSFITNKQPNQAGFSGYRSIPKPRQDQKIARTVPAAISVIESKPAIIKPKISPFIPSSLRSKISK